MHDSAYSSPTKSARGVAPIRDLLFGEIDTSNTSTVQSPPANNSICNLILSSSSIFIRFWLVDNVRETLLDSLQNEDLAALRLVCQDFSGRLAPRLFRDLRVNFKTGTFTRPGRIAALERIGRHSRTFELRLPRTADTVLPPLIDANGNEETFTYTPNASSTAPASAKYGSQHTADMLVKQYPPLFHSSTNVPSFTRALSALPNLVSLYVSSSTHVATQGRRSTVDYALISLRIALERAPLQHLDALSFSPIYPSGLLYMQPLQGLGGNPGSVRRWSQIRHLSINMESSAIDTSTRSDQLKTLHHYLRTFAGSLSSFHFRWHGSKGPSPISLDSEPGIFHCSDRINTHRRTSREGTAIKFTALHHVNVQNAEVDASQISAFIGQHRRTLEEFKFESIKLRTGDWDQALSPLAKYRKPVKDEVKLDEKMEVPVMLGLPLEMKTKIVTPEPDHGQDEHGTACVRHSMLQRLVSRAKARKAKEHIKEGSGHVRSLLRQSIPWR